MAEPPDHADQRYRLVPFEPKARTFLVGEMEKFFFGGGSKAPEGFVNPDS